LILAVVWCMWLVFAHYHIGNSQRDEIVTTTTTITTSDINTNSKPPRLPTSTPSTATPPALVVVPPSRVDTRNVTSHQTTTTTTKDKVNFNSTTTFQLQEPMYHPQYAAGKLKLDPNRRYLIINEHGRGYNNYIFGIVRGIMLARRMGRIPLIRKIFINEHLYPTENWFTELPPPQLVNTMRGENPYMVFKNSRIIPEELANLYPIFNELTSEEYQARYTKYNYKSVYEPKYNTQFVEDYIEDLASRESIVSFVAGTYIPWRQMVRSMIEFRQEKVVAIHNAFYIGLSVKGTVKSVHKYRQDFLDYCKQVLLENLHVQPHTYIAVHMRLGDFLVRTYSKEDTFSVNNITEPLEQLQKYVGPSTQVLIMTNDPNDADIQQQVQAHSDWILSSDISSVEPNPHFSVLFDLMVGHYSKVFIRNPHSTVGLNIMESRVTDPSVNHIQPQIVLEHRGLLQDWDKLKADVDQKFGYTNSFLHPPPVTLAQNNNYMEYMKKRMEERQARFQEQKPKEIDCC
jgi:hypothetical protein